MKTTMDYMVGNTAIQIVNTGKKIKIIDVKKERTKKRFIKVTCTALILTFLSFSSCFYLISMHNSEEVLSREVYALQSEIEQLQNENLLLKKKNENQSIDYKEIFKKAKGLGMRFPSSDQLYEYTIEKSTAVRINVE